MRFKNQSWNESFTFVIHDAKTKSNSKVKHGSSKIMSDYLKQKVAFPLQFYSVHVLSHAVVVFTTHDKKKMCEIKLPFYFIL